MEQQPTLSIGTIDLSVGGHSVIQKDEFIRIIENELEADSITLLEKPIVFSVPSVVPLPPKEKKRKTPPSVKKAEVVYHYPLLKNIDYLELVGENVVIQPLLTGEIEERLSWIGNQPFQEQRSEEWYAFRNSMMTASELHKLFGSDKIEKSFIDSKTIVKKQKSGKSCLHGIMYEELARKIYEERNHTKIYEYGCVRHREISCLGASPDGICVDPTNEELYGKIVEIKCPTTRVIDGKVPVEYALQVQTQLEVLNLEECDYCEFQFKQFATKEEYELEQTVEKGIIIAVTKKTPEGDYDDLYIYSEMGIGGDEKEMWLNRETDALLSMNHCDVSKIIYWKLAEFNCKRIKRNRELFGRLLPRIHEVWKKIELQRALPQQLPQQLNMDESQREMDLCIT